MSPSTTHLLSTMASDGAAERVDPPAGRAYTFPVVRETPIPSAERVGDRTW
jgi:hypothetical protein